MAGDKKGGAPFERDFGYLLPFLDRVQAAGSELSSPAREEVAELMAGEKERWARVRDLLSGAQGRALASPKNQDVRAAPPPKAKVAAQMPRQGNALTVGSLKRR